MSSGPRVRALLRSLLAAAAVLAGAEVAARWLAPEPRLGILARRPLLSLYPGLERPEEVFSSLNHDSLEWSPYLHWVTRADRRGRFFRTNARGCLRQRRPDLDLEVINAGQAGFVSGQELIHFHRAVAELAPDLVLLFDGYNDVEADLSNPVTDWPQNASHLKTRYEDFLRSGRLGADLARFLARSRLLELAGGWLGAGGGGGGGPWTPALDPALTAASYLRNARALSRVASPAPVWVALQPVLATIRKPLAPEEQRVLAGKEQRIRGYASRVRDTYRAIEDGARQAGLPVIPLDDALGSEPVLLFADECHFGDEAADRVAAAISEAWLRQDALPGGAAPGAITGGRGDHGSRGRVHGPLRRAVEPWPGAVRGEGDRLSR
jgi:hypothetical protein